MKKSNDELIIDYLTGELSASDHNLFLKKLNDDSEFSAEYEKVKLAVNLLNSQKIEETPIPNERMDDNFYKLLSEAKQNNQSGFKQGLVGFKKLFTLDFLKPIVYGACMMFLGLFIGSKYLVELNSGFNTKNSQLTTKHENSLQKLAISSMLQLPSVNTRLQAVSLVEKSEPTTDDVIVKALFNTLNNDSNINVRLAALDTLSKFTNTNSVRESLVKSISKQQSPIVQIYIAELMLYLQEKKAVKPLRTLLENKNLIEPARERILYAVNELI